MLSDEPRRRLEEEKNSFEQLYKLQIEKIARLRIAWVIETDPSRKFQYEQQIPEEEDILKDIHDKLSQIEKHLKSTHLIEADASKKITLSDLDKNIRKYLPRKYQLIKKLSESIRVSVYQAHDLDLQRFVAIKVFNSDELKSKEDFKEKVAKAVKFSSHTNFITIYDASFKSKYYYYIMEFIDGYTIRQYIEQKHNFTCEEICLIIIKVGKALIQAREIGFTYNNIKPSNILLVKNDKNNEYQPFITPLSLSEQQTNENPINNLKELQEPQTKEYLRELPYLSPEEFEFFSTKVKRPEFKKSVQYSLGILAYELFTHKIPTLLQDSKSLENQELKKLPPFREKAYNCPEIIEKIILKMASPEPEDRYEDIQDVLDLIHRHIDFNINTAKESYKRCAFEPNFDNKFFDIFYKKFIEKCPESKSKFSTFDENEKKKQEEYWNRQHQLLKQAVLVLFAYFEEKEQLNSSDYYEQEEPNILSRIAEVHDRYHKNIPTIMYTAFVNALIETVIEFDPWCNGSQENDNKERRLIVKDAWQKVLKPGVEYMQTKY